MSNKRQHEKVRSRNDAFATKVATKIWCEQASEKNPYIASRALCHGYDLRALMEKRSFVDVFYLLFKGELPTSEQAQLLEALMIGLIHPGPRHPASRAAMNAGVGKTRPEHILPIASAVISGEYLGAAAVEPAMRFLTKERKQEPALVLERALESKNTLGKSAQDKLSQDNFMTPGFGQVYGGIDELCRRTAADIAGLPGAGSVLQWGQSFAELGKACGLGWLPTGLAAAVFVDLGFQARAGGSLFQLLSAPGLVAQGLELANKPLTAMPYVSDEDYVVKTHVVKAHD